MMIDDCFVDVKDSWLFWIFIYMMIVDSMMNTFSILILKHNFSLDSNDLTLS